MKNFFTDLHIHVGISEQGQWIKIPTSRRLTIRNIITEAANRKGMDIIGIVDALSPLVLADLEHLLEIGMLSLQSGGGYRYLDTITLMLGAEIETIEDDGGLAHTLIFLPSIIEMKKFSQHMAKYIRNINLSSQNAHITLGALVDIAGSYEAMIIPAHVFTPHKSLYGSCCKRLEHILSENQINQISAIELGLSADSLLADRIAELAEFSFLTNSDAHSLDKIAREYNILTLIEPTFEECKKSFKRQKDRYISANYGLDPRLGKYHRTVCMACGCSKIDQIPVTTCPECGSNKIVKGVFNTIDEIADFNIPNHPEHRPPYYYQIPLEFVPGLGKKSMEKLLQAFGTEMNILHQATQLELTAVIGERLAEEVIKVRSGLATIIDGGGGVYGKIARS